MSVTSIRERLIIEPRGENPERWTMIGGTDIAPILGVSTKRTRFAVWLSKTRPDLRPPEDESSEEAEAGLFLEPLVLSRFSKRLHVKVSATPLTYRLRSTPYLGMNPDGLVHAREDGGPIIGGVDAKTRHPFVRSLWGDEGSDNIPADEFMQGQWYCHLSNLDAWWFAVFFDRRLSVFCVRRDEELCALAEKEAIAFWQDHVLTRTPPTFEGPAAGVYLKHRFPTATDPRRDADEEEVRLVLGADRLRREIEAQKDRLTTIRHTLASRIGAAEGLKVPGFSVSYSERSGSGLVDWEAVVAELRSFPLTTNPDAARELREAIDLAVKRHTKPATATRVLMIRPQRGLTLAPAPQPAALTAATEE